MKRYTESITSVNLEPKGYHLKQMSECPEAINKLGKLEDLEEQLGCPLEVVFKALTNGIYIKNIYDEMVNFKVMLVHKSKELGYYFRFINDGYVLLTDYKKTFWLKEDKSE